ncbi:MAG: type II toxin-antitoxin system HicA family toxin [Chloroflexi bacterium]|nr:type II toxin-antitoxin system HicA family toxin [Chloroflexota bacterium]
MSPRLPRVTATELLRALQRAGWYRDHQTGSHVFLRHEARPGTLNVPFHAGRVIKPAILERILEVAGLSADELRRLL